jgi:hypothetical protein
MSSLHRLAYAAVLFVAAGAVVSVALPEAHADPVATTVTVNARAGLATVAPTALGVNDAIWDTKLGTTTVSDLLGVHAERHRLRRGLNPAAIRAVAR